MQRANGLVCWCKLQMQKDLINKKIYITINFKINGIIPQGKPWALFSEASLGELNHPSRPPKRTRRRIKCPTEQISHVFVEVGIIN